MIRPTLYIMAKAPIMGRAKTRLAADIGVTHAKRIYRRMMSGVIRGTQDPRWDTVLMVTPPLMMGHVPEWAGHYQRAQVSGSLSPKLCPQVNAPDIARAFKALRSNPAVFGPASDGGFWLMGARAPLPPSTFDGVRWSSEHTLADMRARVGEVAVLRTLTDVDDLAALRKSKSK